MYDLNDDMSIYYETLNERPDIGWFLQGHIVIEYMLRKRLIEINPKYSTTLAKSGFYRVLQKAHEEKIVDDARKDVLAVCRRA